MKKLDDIAEKLQSQLSQPPPNLPKTVDKPPYDGPCAEDCEICGGVGHVRQDLPVGHPDYGKLTRCPNTPVSKLAAPSNGLHSMDAYLKFDDLKKINGITEAIRDIETTIQRGWGWVYIHGSYGDGKTQLLKTATAIYVRQHKSAIYTTMADILEHLRGAYDTNDPNYESQARLNRLADVDLLCIDEIDRIRNTEYAEEKRFTLLDRRYESAIRTNSITIMTSNQPPSVLPGAIHDRLRTAAFFTIQLGEKSYRPAMDHKHIATMRRPQK